MRDFRVQTALYFGPMDLLVQLVRAHEIDPLALSLADIAAAFLRALEAQSQPPPLDEVGEFLVLATTLMELKSRKLLPHETEEAVAALEPAKQEFLKQLLEYRRFKEAASLLWQKAVQHRQHLPRQAAGLDRNGRPGGRGLDPAQQPIRELELWDLVSAFSRLMRENIVPATEAVARDPTPMPVHMDRLEAWVVERNGVGFAELFGTDNTKPVLIGKFLALLELIKLGRVWVEWNDTGDSIVVLPPRARPAVESAVAIDAVLAAGDIPGAERTGEPITSGAAPAADGTSGVDAAIMADTTPPPDVAAGNAPSSKRSTQKKQPKRGQTSEFTAAAADFEDDPEIAAELESFEQFTADLLDRPVPGDTDPPPPRRSAWDDYEPLLDDEEDA